MFMSDIMQCTVYMYMCIYSVQGSVLYGDIMHNDMYTLEITLNIDVSASENSAWQVSQHPYQYVQHPQLCLSL